MLVAVAVATLGAEIQLARRGADLVAPDVRTLAATFPAEAPPTQPATRVLWLGDSTAAGVGASDPAHALSSQVGERLAAASTSHDWDMDVIAVSGARISDVVRDQLPRVHDHTPDVVVISVGANDTVHLTGVRSFRVRYERLIDALVAQHVRPDHVVLIGVPDMGAPPRLAQPLRAVTGWRGRRLDRQVRRVARAKGVRYVDLFHATSKPFRSHPSEYFARDDYHPSDAGYGLWANAVAPAVQIANELDA